MRNQLATPFWKNAFESLPAEWRTQYVQDFEAAERWELRIATLVKLASRMKAAVLRMFQTPRSAHQ